LLIDRQKYPDEISGLGLSNLTVAELCGRSVKGSVGAFRQKSKFATPIPVHLGLNALKWP